jgi:demethylmenaquinone methyltransferase / 2-methoxy-6-polyprenyl-1,4-benzoquinol methylase
MFGEIAPRYDLLNHVLSLGIDIYWRDRTVRQCPPSNEAPILDVCTGTGDLALAYWKRGHGRIPVMATDFTHQMLTRANAKRDRQLGSAAAPASESTAEGTAPLVFLEADTQKLPFASNLFQLVTVAFGLRNVTDTRKGLEEMIRVCQPGGRVVVLEFSMPTQSVLGGLYRWYFKSVLPRVGQALARNQHSAYNYLPASVTQFPNGRELTQLMESCGLIETKFTPRTFGIATIYEGTKPAAAAGDAAIPERLP